MKQLQRRFKRSTLALVAALGLAGTASADASQAFDGSARIAAGSAQAVEGSVMIGAASAQVVAGAVALPIAATGEILSGLGAGSTAVAEGLWDAATTELVIGREAAAEVAEPSPAQVIAIDVEVHP